MFRLINLLLFWRSFSRRGRLCYNSLILLSTVKNVDHHKPSKSWSADLHGLLASGESVNCKNQFPCSQKTLSRHYKTLQPWLGYIWKYFEISHVKGQDNLRYTKLIIYYIKHETQCFIARWNTEKRVENTTRSGVFFSNKIIFEGEIKDANTE